MRRRNELIFGGGAKIGERIEWLTQSGSALSSAIRFGRVASPVQVARRRQATPKVNQWSTYKEAAGFPGESKAPPPVAITVLRRPARRFRRSSPSHGTRASSELKTLIRLLSRSRSISVHQMKSQPILLRERPPHQVFPAPIMPIKGSPLHAVRLLPGNGYLFNVRRLHFCKYLRVGRNFFLLIIRSFHGSFSKPDAIKRLIAGYPGRHFCFREQFTHQYASAVVPHPRMARRDIMVRVARWLTSSFLLILSLFATVYAQLPDMTSSKIYQPKLPKNTTGATAGRLLAEYGEGTLPYVLIQELRAR